MRADTHHAALAYAVGSLRSLARSEVSSPVTLRAALRCAAAKSLGECYMSACLQPHINVLIHITLRWHPMLSDQTTRS